MYAVEKHIPLPSRNNKYPFRSMKPGDSFLVKTDKEPVSCVRNRLCAAMIKFAANKEGMKFTTRYTTEGIRCWRVH